MYVTSCRVSRTNYSMQNKEPEHPLYPYLPVGSLTALSRMLHCSLEELSRIAEGADRLYRTIEIVKPDGDVRTCYDAKPPLKSIQARIQCMILKKVKYPSYLMGGLADPVYPRDYVRNAHVHRGARVQINEDISKFFPSLSSDIVYDVWQHFFHFPGDVARILTHLTTREGRLPQGAKTSSYLCNLAFWSTEPAMVSKLQSAGFAYTRYVDDISISSIVDRSANEMHKVLSSVASMVKRYGLRFKRRKHRVAYAGQRMEVTGLVLGERGAGMHYEKRSNIRALVHRCEQDANSNQQSPMFPILKRRAAALVGQYARLHPKPGAALRSRLKALKAG
jgi:hypothetical protein